MYRMFLFHTLIYILLSSTTASAAPKYSITVLPLYPYHINNRDDIAGQYLRQLSKVQGCALYRKGRIIDLDPMDKSTPPSNGDKSMSVDDLNDSGQIVGDYTTTGARLHGHPYVWSKGKITFLTGEWVNSINNKGEIVGSGESDNVEDPGSDAIYWKNSKSTPINIGKKYGWRHSGASAINNRGDIVGNCADRSDTMHPFLIHNGKVTVMKKLGARFINYEMMDINDNRQVLIYATDQGPLSPPKYRAFILEKGKLRDLGLQTGWNIKPCALNNRGQVVGNFTKDNGTTRPFLWSNGQFHDINQLIPKKMHITITSVIDLNDRGDILASGIQNGKHVSLLLKS